MFTGIIEATGSIKKIELNQSPDPRTLGDAKYWFNTGKLNLNDVSLGDSISCNGVCLTVIEKLAKGFIADVSVETIRVTRFKDYVVGQAVNFEKAMLPTTRLGGHMVSGHVDAIGQVIDIKEAARSIQYEIEAPKNVLRYIAVKGSITIDGISLTVNALNSNERSNSFYINLVPHTLKETIADSYKVGTKLNLEIDLIARYLERLMTSEK